MRQIQPTIYLIFVIFLIFFFLEETRFTQKMLRNNFNKGTINKTNNDYLFPF